MNKNALLVLVALSFCQFHAQAAVQENRDKGKVGKKVGGAVKGMFKKKEQREEDKKEEEQAALGRILIAQCEKPGAGKDPRTKIMSCTSYTLWQLAGPTIEASLDETKGEDRIPLNTKSFTRKQIQHILGDDSEAAPKKQPAAQSSGQGSPIQMGSSLPIGAIGSMINKGTQKVDPGYNFADATIIMVSAEVAAKLGKKEVRYYDLRPDTTQPIDAVKTSTYDEIYKAISAL